MQKGFAVLFALLTIGAIVLVVAGGGHRASKQVAARDGGADASASTASASRAADAGAPDAEAAGEPASEEATVDAGGALLTGEAPPPLAGDAPKQVAFGVILVTYRGAQGAPPTARSREQALELAKQLAAEAKTDFKAAVAKGDKGSSDNMGHISRGYLEPAPEYVLFSLPKGGVSDPVDTPKGFWIVRRIE
jgi:parvulin-like peptidyl-prolyl isomerase